MVGITPKDVYFNVAKSSVQGLKEPKNEIYHSNKLPKTVQKAIQEGQITQDEYVTMLEYAKWLPSGHRRLKLNYAELRNTLVSKDLKHAPLTKTSGLNKGGMTAVKGAKALTQREHLNTIMNKNRINKSQWPYTNPNFTSFANHAALK